jgi:hypothetical protein
LPHHVHCITRLEGVRQLLLSSLLPARNIHASSFQGVQMPIPWLRNLCYADG